MEQRSFDFYEQDRNFVQLADQIETYETSKLVEHMCDRLFEMLDETNKRQEISDEIILK